MKDNFNFKKISKTIELDGLKQQWLASLTAPQDGMWQSFMDNASQWAFLKEDQVIGYACVDSEGQLIQFFILSAWRDIGVDLLNTFIGQEGIKKAMVGTNNPVFLSAALHIQQSIIIDTYLFTEYVEVENIEKEGFLKEGTLQNLEELVDFCHFSLGAPKAWLKGYLDNLISRKEIFIFRNEKDIIGTCEVRISDTDSRIADIGMIVSPLYRKQGYGTFLLGKAKGIAIRNRKTPICSCEKDNVGSLKSIQKNGFRSIHQLLAISF